MTLCHWTHPHQPHEWWPIVADPDNPRVLYVIVSVDCPGVPA